MYALDENVGDLYSMIVGIFIHYNSFTVDRENQLLQDLKTSVLQLSDTFPLCCDSIAELDWSLYIYYFLL